MWEQLGSCIFIWWNRGLWHMAGTPVHPAERETSSKLDLTLQFPIDLMGWHNYYPGGVSGRSNLITIAAIHTQICPSLDFLQPKEIAVFLPMLKCFRTVDVVWCLCICSNLLQPGLLGDSDSYDALWVSMWSASIQMHDCWWDKRECQKHEGMSS